MRVEAAPAGKKRATKALRTWIPTTAILYQFEKLTSNKSIMKEDANFVAYNAEIMLKVGCDVNPAHVTINISWNGLYTSALSRSLAVHPGCNTEGTTVDMSYALVFAAFTLGHTLCLALGAGHGVQGRVENGWRIKVLGFLVTKIAASDRRTLMWDPHC